MSENSPPNSRAAASDHGEPESPFTLAQGGETYEIEPLRYQGQSLEEFYGRVQGSANTPTNVEAGAETSKLFLYEDAAGVSLVVIHDDDQSGPTASGGEAIFEFDGLDGSWVVTDDPHDWFRKRSSPPETIHWAWAGGYTDGGAFRFDDEEFAVTITPDFRHGITDWEVLSGDAADPERISLALEEPVTLQSGPQRVTASVTTLQFIPGKEENPSRGGHPLNSGLMQIIPGEGGEISIPWTDTSVGMYPMFDSWVGGDMRENIPETLEEARKPKDDKYEDDTPGAFNEYRFENGLNISFETTGEGNIDEDTIEIQFNEAGPSGDDPNISRGTEQNSRTVLHDHEVNTIPWRDWYDGENVKRSRRQPRYYEYDTDFEFDGVEGVRVFTVWGGWAAFMDDLSERVSENAATFFSELWGWPVPEDLAKAALAAAPTEVQFAIDSMSVVPNTYSVLDFIVLADGRRYVRVWDASEYPSLATYVDGELQELEQMPYEPREWFNRDMFAFTVHAMEGVTPYQSLALRYFKAYLRNEPAIRNDLEETLIEFVRLLDLPWGVHELMPSVPRETLAFDANGEPLDDPDAPFGTGIIMKPWSRLGSR